jgi:hypothetical protein
LRRRQEVTVRSWTVLAFVVFVSLGPRASLAAESAAPSPNLLFQLQKQNRARPLWRVNTDSGRFTARIAGIERFGLSGLEAPPESPAAPPRLPWPAVSRLDEVTTRAHAGRVLGAIAGTLIGAGFVNVIWPDKNGSLVFVGGGLLGVAAGWQGAQLGARRTRDRTWYERAAGGSASSPDTAALAGSVADSVQAAVAGAAGGGLSPSAPPDSLTRLSASPEALRASSLLRTEDMLRLRGTFGTIEGHVAVAGPEGLERIEATTRSGEAPPGELIRWDRIDTIEKRVGSSLYGAAIGGVVLGTVGFLFGFALAGLADYPTVGTRVGGGLFFALPTAAIGGTLGALLGAPVPRWQIVYRRPVK